jgi:site-specific DNA-methyltransferase (adenine-specific)
MKKFNIIYADPPWTYRRGGKGSAKRHYPLMKTEDICALPVGDLADEDCALFLWATMPLLPEAFEAIKAWGFTYKTAAFTWCKTNKNKDGYFIGLGNWTRANAEICLLAIRGKPKREAKNVPQLIAEPRREHSRKPDVARERIIALMGDLPRVELFARQAPKGWDVWGNEVTPTIDFTSGHVVPKC